MGGVGGVLETVNKLDIPLMGTCTLIRKETCRQDGCQRVMSARLRLR